MNRMSHARRWRAALAFAAALAVSCAARGQVFELSAGDSTAYDARGGSLLIHGEHSESSLGFGWTNGHFGADAESIRHYGQRTLMLGQQQMSMDLPTDVFEASHLFSGNGIGLKRSSSESGVSEAKDGWTLFAGVGSDQAGTPLFQSAVLHTPAAALRWRKTIGHGCYSLLTAVAGGPSSFLPSVACQLNSRWLFAIAAGVGGGLPYEATSLRFNGRRATLRAAYIASAMNFNRTTGPVQAEPVGLNVAGTYDWTRNVQFSGLHQSFRTRSTIDAPVTAGLVAAGTRTFPESRLDEAAADYNGRNGSFSVAALHSSFRENQGGAATTADGDSTGFSVSAQREWSRYSLTEVLLASRSNQEPLSSTLLSTLAMRFNAHLLLEETLNLTGGHVNLSEGGELATRFGRARVEYEMFYVPTNPREPFEQVMVFSVQARLLHRLTVEADSTVNPLGKTVYTFQLGTSYARGAAAGVIAVKTLGGSLGAYSVHGRVVEVEGTPLEGAVVMLDGKRLYTDSHGRFSLRENRARAHALQVMTNEFQVPGSFAIVHAPATINSLRGEEEFEIVVMRLPPPGTGLIAAHPAAIPSPALKAVDETIAADDPATWEERL